VEIARMLLARPGFVVLTWLEASLDAAAAVDVLAALKARGIGCLLLEHEAPASWQVDLAVRIAADGAWTRTQTDSAATR
jgi:ABC-type lipopolysaccharide export system ATPase subunit